MMMSVYVFAKNFFAIEWLVQPETARNEQEKEGGVGYKISIIQPLLLAFLPFLSESVIFISFYFSPSADHTTSSSIYLHSLYHRSSYPSTSIAIRHTCNKLTAK